MTRGWHLWNDNWEGEPDYWPGFGPGLGRTVTGAKRMAEAWIICPYRDMMGCWPSLRNALTGSASWADGLSVCADDDSQRFVVRRAEGAVCQIVPLFLGAGGATSIRWRAIGPDGGLLYGADTWADVVGVGAELQHS